MHSYTHHLLVIILAFTNAAIAIPSLANRNLESENPSDVVSISSELITQDRERSLLQDAVNQDKSAIASDSVDAGTQTRRKSPLLSRIFFTLQQ